MSSIADIHGTTVSHTVHAESSVAAGTLRREYPSQLPQEVIGPLQGPDGTPLRLADLSHDGASYLRCKRYFDVCGAIALLLFFTPIMAVIAVIIFAWDQGPILYTQTRVGQNGRLFPFFKFRSMVRNADTLREGLAEQNEASGPIFKIRHDPRVTPIGRIIRRYSLDELPQLFNVLKGDISLVGPRPHRPCEVAEYRPHHYYRLLVPQGLICLREVSGRSKLSFERWIELDLQYVEHRSFGADFKILCRVIPAVFRGDGAY